MLRQGKSNQTASAPEVSSPSVASGVSAAVAAPREYTFEQTYPDEQSVSALAWQRAHAARAFAREEKCWDLAQGVGVPAQPGMLCLFSSKREYAVHARIYRWDGGKLSRVWDGIVATYANWLELVPVLSADGAELYVHDRNVGACEGAMCEAEDKVMHGVSVDWSEDIARGCVLRGLHRFQNGRFEQVTKEPLEDSCHLR